MLEYTEGLQNDIKIRLGAYPKGKTSLKTLGFSDRKLSPKGGFLRIVFEFTTTNNNYSPVPQIKFSSKSPMEEVYWQCSFNQTDIVDNIQYEEDGVLISLNRSKMNNLENWHYNSLTVQAEFQDELQLSAAKSLSTFIVNFYNCQSCTEKYTFHFFGGIHFTIELKPIIQSRNLAHTTTNCKFRSQHLLFKTEICNRKSIADLNSRQPSRRDRQFKPSSQSSIA